MDKLILNTIKTGVVIDHLNIETTKNIFDMLHINSHEFVSMGLNLRSRKQGLKGIIKIENRTLSQVEIDKITFLAPEATINVIVDGKVIDKMHTKSPEKSVNIFKCNNNKCITNNERNISTIFSHKQENEILIAKCEFCERVFELSELGFLNENN